MSNHNRSKKKVGKYNVYVIELDQKIWLQNRKFRAANPQYNGRSRCLYVGMTYHSPKERFLKHKTGYRNKKGIKISSRIVEKYGKFLRPSLYAPLNPMTKERAIKMERALAEHYPMVKMPEGYQKRSISLTGLVFARHSLLPIDGEVLRTLSFQI